MALGRRYLEYKYCRSSMGHALGSNLNLFIFFFLDSFNKGSFRYIYCFIGDILGFFRFCNFFWPILQLTVLVFRGGQTRQGGCSWGCTCSRDVPGKLLGVPRIVFRACS